MTLDDLIYLAYLDSEKVPILAKKYGVTRQAIYQRIWRIRRKKTKELFKKHRETLQLTKKP